jgi:hypothetical protein
MWINPTTQTVLRTHSDVRRDCAASLPADITDEILASVGYLPVTLIAPQYDPLTQSAVELPPALVNGHWTQQWTVTGLDPEVATANQQATEAARVASLWQAAHDYEYAQVSGSAIGLLAMGVMQGLPKCLAVQNWIKTIWAAYYERKATGSTNFDFSRSGECPHSVPELMQELGV